MAATALMNVMMPAARKAGRGLTRDFGEVEQLQVSRKGPADFVSVAESIAFWVERDGCDPEPTRETSDGGNVVHDVYTGGADGADVELYSIENGGHFWPGGFGEPDNGISATDLLWEFFSDHPKL